MALRQLAFALTLLAGALGAQGPAALEVTGAVQQPRKFTVDDLARMPRASVKMAGKNGQTVYEGVWLHEILKRAGAPQGETLRGKALAGYVLAEASDGYQVVFSLGEVDPSFIDNEILVADRADGKPLDGAQGRLRLVVPKDKHGSRSVRMLTKLEVAQLRK